MTGQLFTYGALMIPSILRRVTRRSFPHQEAILTGYARYRIRGQSSAGITAEEGAELRGILYSEIDPDSYRRIDEFEGNWYARTVVRVATRFEKEVEAETYVILPEHRDRLSREPWNLEECCESLLEEYLGDREGLPSI
jgi:gamma-glutamylcyclotransferase (GGCT)/AIG2-like uncharacterized protein YtfP